MKKNFIQFYHYNNFSLSFHNNNNNHEKTKKADLINGLSCQLNDVYHISEIEDISISSHKNDDNEFTIKQDRGRPSLVFTSPKRDNIMSSIRSSKARYQIARPTNITERVIRPSDV